MWDGFGEIVTLDSKRVKCFNGSPTELGPFMKMLHMMFNLDGPEGQTEFSGGSPFRTRKSLGSVLMYFFLQNGDKHGYWIHKKHNKIAVYCCAFGCLNFQEVGKNMEKP